MRVRTLLCFFLFNPITFLFAADSGPVSFQAMMERIVDLDTLYLPPTSRAQMFSSYDREKGNRDDQGMIRQEGDWKVVAEMTGPGAVTRIWTSKPTGTIQIFIDNPDTPVLEVPFKNLFNGKVAPFEKPFVHGTIQTEGPHWSYIPILYKSYCKIRLSEASFYQIEYAVFSPETEVQPFRYPPTKEEDKVIKEVGKKFVPSVKTPFAVGKTLSESKFTEKVPAGETIQLASFAGPGVLRGFRLYWGRGDADLGRDLLVKMYWDGEKKPSVHAPVHDFFGSRTQTLALGVESGSVRYCYFPMPFRTSARIELENENLQRAYSIRGSFYLQTDVELPLEDLRKFHAYWKRENETRATPVTYAEPFAAIPCDPQQNYVGLETWGTGHLVGLTVYRTPSPESDTMIFVDGPTWPPALPGCGNEGFFDMAGKIQTIDWPLAGGIQNFMRLNCAVRLFLSQPIAFEQGLSLTMEHGPSNLRHKDYSTTAYWYETEASEITRWMLPPGARHFRQEPLAKPVYVVEEGVAVPAYDFYESDRLAIEAIGGHYEPQDMLPYGTDWSENQQILFKAFDAGGLIRFVYPPMPYSGWYSFDGVLTQMPDGGTVQIEMNDDVVIRDLSLQGRERLPKRARSKQAVFLHASDQPEITIRLQGMPAEKKQVYVGIDTVGLVSVDAECQAVSVVGPLGLPGDPQRPNGRWVQSLDGHKLLLGYDDKDQDLMPSVDLPANAQKRFDIGHLVAEAGMNEGLCLVRWNVEMEHAGIYRLDIGPGTVTPFLLQEEENQIKALSRKLMVNGVVLRGSETVRFDAEQGMVLPYRYNVPLKEGMNEIAWLLRCDHKTQFFATLYGAGKP
ncbi:MAG: DUF2961 domain-containing protein [bacterium]|nr:DUF2961 domain-containing protein [bacterium]